jgi:hypothetical protein
MSALDIENTQTFEYEFSDNPAGFTAWLDEYLIAQSGYPFSMGGAHALYDLGDLFAAILTESVGRTKNVRVIETSCKNILREVRHDFHLQKLSNIAYAAARSRFAALVPELAFTIEEVLVSAELSNSIRASDRANAVVELDKTISSLASLSLISDDPKTAEVNIRLFENPELALFSSSLFTPVALQRIEEWPALWVSLVDNATTPMSILQLTPDGIGQFTMPWQSNRKAFFDPIAVFRYFFAEADRRHVSLFQPIEAVSNGAGKCSASMLSHLSSLRRANILKRTDSYDSEYDIWYFSKTMWAAVGLEVPPDSKLQRQLPHIDMYGNWAAEYASGRESDLSGERRTSLHKAALLLAAERSATLTQHPVGEA